MVINIDRFSRQAKAIADPTRIRMLKLLENGELCVCEIMNVLGLGQSTASKHLNILKTAGLVEARKDATWSFYRLSRKEIGANKALLRIAAANLNNDETIEEDRKLLRKERKNLCRR